MNHVCVTAGLDSRCTWSMGFAPMHGYVPAPGLRYIDSISYVANFWNWPLIAEIYAAFILIASRVVNVTDHLSISESAGPWSAAFVPDTSRTFCLMNHCDTIKSGLTHLPLDKMSAISQMTFSNTFSWMKNFEFWLTYHRSLFLRVQLTIIQHWFR